MPALDLKHVKHPDGSSVIKVYSVINGEVIIVLTIFTYYFIFFLVYIRNPEFMAVGSTVSNENGYKKISMDLCTELSPDVLQKKTFKIIVRYYQSDFFYIMQIRKTRYFYSYLN